MRAVVYREYGSPDVLRLEDVEPPTPKANEVLVQVFATTVNRTDCAFRKPEPFIVRLFHGVLRPSRPILGSELAGEVVAVGAAVTQFAVGDHVFGVHPEKFGAHAELVCLAETAPLARKPAAMTFEEAASVCDGAILALAVLRLGNLQPGHKVLIYGASGSIGTAAVQLAKHFETHVTAVCNTRNVETVRTLGADAVIDYTQQDFTGDGEIYDFVFDAVGKSSFARCKRALKRGGIFVSADVGWLWQNVFLALWTPLFGRKRVKFPIPRYTQADVQLLRQLIEAGKYQAVIDRRYPFDQLIDATRYVETEQKTGNVVVVVDGARSPRVT
ncbi:MAG: NAD(P)-dependent alcohol dehydrogenase [Myxococcales bacterium]|nr:NAD(P)-dependent alcohol dehydrogenase [Myxococcales bacterium]